MIKALLFDFGRVISAPKPGSLFHLYEKELGLAPDTINTIMFDSPFWQQALVGRLTMSEYWQAIGPQLNLMSEEKVRAFEQRYFDDETINPVMPGLLEQFAEPFRLAIVSNHPPGLHEWLAAWKIEHFFEVVICSGDVGVAKPDPAVFFLALDRLDIGAPEAFFIDDTAEHVRAARRSACMAITSPQRRNYYMICRGSAPLLSNFHTSLTIDPYHPAPPVKPPILQSIMAV